MSTAAPAAVAIASRLPKLGEQLAAWREQGHNVALVSTLGHLHRGHQALIKAAAKQADRVVVCAYVNPLQFGPEESPNRFPRSNTHDAEAVAAAGGHLLFAPADFDLFPSGVEGGARVDVAELAGILCGRTRPWFFPAVTTVTMKLIDAIQPQLIVVGEKDYQQLVILRRVVTDLLLGVKVVAVPTVREHDGLAVSTSNRLLSVRERNIASRLYEMLVAVRRRLQRGERDYALLQDVGMKTLERAGFVPEYVSVRQAADLAPARADTQHYAVLAAAHLGACRLADNLVFKLDAASGQPGPSAQPS